MNLDDLNRELRAKHLAGFWAEKIVAFGRDIEPRAGAQAHLWRWPDIYDGLMPARELVSLEQSERRTIRLMIPGEVAKAHRHASNVNYHAFRGAGRTFIGEQMLECAKATFLPCRCGPGTAMKTPRRARRCCF